MTTFISIMAEPLLSLKCQLRIVSNTLESWCLCQKLDETRTNVEGHGLVV